MYSGVGRPVMQIRIPAGSNVLYAESMSTNTGIGEEEYILPRGSALRFAGKTGDKPGSTRYQFDLVPRTAADWNPFQPRAPKGTSQGGEWIEGEGGGGSFSSAPAKVGLETAHQNALRQYAASIYQPVNKGLRDRTQLSSLEQEVVRTLDEAFDRAMKTTELMQLFRAAGEEFADYVDAIKVGEDLTDEAFVSTTTDERLARTFLSGQPGEKKVLVEIVLPKDSRAIDTSPFNPFKGENEVLLPRNTKFRYLGMERDVYRFRANPAPRAADSEEDEDGE
jgi:hypothetical protein